MAWACFACAATLVAQPLFRSLALNRPLLVLGSQPPAGDEGREADLRIAKEPNSGRALITGTEVEVSNFGGRSGEGQLLVDAVNEDGMVLASIEPLNDRRLLSVPAYRLGGREGRRVRLALTTELIELLGGLERKGSPYAIRATIRTLGRDANWRDDTSEKEWRKNQTLRPGREYRFRYGFSNNTRETVLARWNIEIQSVPAGGSLRFRPEPGTFLSLAAGRHDGGTVRFRAPAVVREGSFLAVRATLLDLSGKVLSLREWFLVADTVPPMVSNYRALVLGNRTIAVQVLVGDPNAGVRPFGVNTVYSVDGGRTWAVMGMEPRVARTSRLILFEGVVGPFAPGAKLLLGLRATDAAGNRQRALPLDARAFLAPENSERLFGLHQAAAATEGNPLFGWEGLIKPPAEAGVLECAGLSCNTNVPFLHGIERNRAADYRAMVDSLRSLQIAFSSTRDLKARLRSASLAGIVAPQFLELSVP